MQDQTSPSKPGVNHPTPEEWVAYLYGETTKTARPALRAHLRSCAECHAKVREWQAMKETLNGWRLESTPATARSAAAMPALKWALAALVVLGLGYGIGLAAAPRMSAEQIRAAVEPALKASLSSEIRAQVQAELRHDWQAVLRGGPAAQETTFRRELRAGFEQWATQVVQASATETERQMQDWAEEYRRDQQQKEQAFATLVEDMERKHQLDQAGLRRALETVAVVADDKFQQTESQLGQLASMAQFQLISDESDQPVKPVNLNHTDPRGTP